MLFKEYRTTGAKPLHFTKLSASSREQINYISAECGPLSHEELQHQGSTQHPIQEGKCVKVCHDYLQTLNKTAPKKKACQL